MINNKPVVFKTTHVKQKSLDFISKTLAKEGYIANNQLDKNNFGVIIKND